VLVTFPIGSVTERAPSLKNLLKLSQRFFFEESVTVEPVTLTLSNSRRKAGWTKTKVTIIVQVCIKITVKWCTHPYIFSKFYKNPQKES